MSWPGKESDGFEEFKGEKSRGIDSFYTFV